MWCFVCWFMKKLCQHLAALNSKHLCSHSFCGSGMQVWLSWVPWGRPGSLTRFNQDAGQDVGVGLISRLRWGGFYSQTCSWLLPGLSSSQAVGLTKVLSAFLAVGERSSSLPPRRAMGLSIGQPTTWQLASSMQEGRQQEGSRSLSLT